MAQKWIINDDDLILSNDVEFHEQLLTGDRKKKSTAGGGLWYNDRERGVIFFWGRSVDFGQVTEKQFDYAFKQPSVEASKIFFSLKLKFEDVLKEYKIFCNKNKL